MPDNTRISVLIVDDERLFIDDLTDIYDWNYNGFDIVATASNGVQALALYKKLNPQIVVTDIRMPFLDGLELAKQIRQLNSSTVIILLTSFEDFSYAQKAIQYCVTDYMLKGNLNSKLVSEKMAMARQLVQKDSKKKKLLFKALVSNLFRQTSAETIEQNTEIHLLNRPFIYLFAELDKPLSLASADNDEPVKWLANYDDFSDSRLKHILSTYLPNQVAIMIFETENLSRNEIFVELSHAAAKILDQTRTLEHHFTLFKIASPMTLEELKNQYDKYHKAMRMKYFLGTGNVYSFDQLPEEIRCTIAAFNESLFMQHLQAFDIQKADHYIDQYFETLKVSYNYDALVSSFDAIYHTLNRFANTAGHKLALPSGSDLDYQYGIDGLRLWVKETINMLIEKQCNENGQPLSPKIRSAVIYINSNFDDKDLTIKKISEFVQLSPGRTEYQI